ncbi:hypothetical protein NIES4101_45720 [Calothrix sp. NIES-4101]|nr:hypothetical protein NIES4101_45720 [Calothrix sp. NIES-4101]
MAVLTADNSVLLNQIGSDVCQAIVTIQEQQPHLLLEKYRNIPWSSDRHQAGLKNKLAEVLGTAKDAANIQQRLQKFLKALLSPKSFESQIVIDLIAKVIQLCSLNTNINTNTNIRNNIVVAPQQLVNPANGENFQPVVTTETLQPQHLESLQIEKTTEKIAISAENTQKVEKEADKIPATTTLTGITVLLLDAENLQLNPETEKFLTTICHSPIQVKVAFANWARKGKLDAELHQRGYDLIHVPSGKDNADGKMIAYGSSICDRFPNAKEVLVCSSDNVMTNLCNHLQQHGLTVYRVTKQGCNLKVLENQSSKTWQYVVLPSVEQFITQIKDIMRDEESRTGNQWLKLSKLSQIFHSKYNIGVKQVIFYHFPGKTAKDIFLTKPEFVVHQLPEDSETYIALFKMPQQSNNGDTPKGKK